ncbi:hypothetical protein AMAG_17220 [Allomyces macrogynus ATCC 38327]|uniref:Uncharacterized protein n=1 Tax=Allomyces macrogynus (strain ATCC 38327) TaxID=578462 RepID=A0A0L0TEB5_ALLM3|nr:hypothetical protein AMAG_17220 [Allomyces macrogynus ATCC 38327]|eukprot:KNE73010.1 hypothetical protein AMAG_17220 [Allomyces macrogynus ATCC 38327]
MNDNGQDQREVVAMRPKYVLSPLESLPTVVLDRLVAALVPKPNLLPYFGDPASRTHVERIFADPDGVRALMQLAYASPVLYAQAVRWAIRVAPLTFVAMSSPSTAACRVENDCDLDPSRMLLGRLGYVEMGTAMQPRLFLITNVAWQPNSDLIRPDLRRKMLITIQVPCFTVPVPFHHVKQFRSSLDWPVLPPFVADLAVPCNFRDLHSLPCGLSNTSLALPRMLERLHLEIPSDPNLQVLIAEKIAACPSLAVLVLSLSFMVPLVVDLNEVFGPLLCKLPPRLRSLTVDVVLPDNEGVKYNLVNGAIPTIQLPSRLSDLSLIPSRISDLEVLTALFDSFLDALVRNPAIILHQLELCPIDWRNKARRDRFATVLARNAPGRVLHFQQRRFMTGLDETLIAIVDAGGAPAFCGLKLHDGFLHTSIDDYELASAFSHFTALTTLQLRGMNVTAPFVTALAQLALPRLVHLAHLDLSGNRNITDLAMTALAPALAEIVQIRTLDLSQTDLTDTAIRVLAKMSLPKLVKLRTLRLSYLKITSVIDLAGGLRRNVQYVDLDGCPVRYVQPLLNAPVGRWGRTVKGGRDEATEWWIERVDEGDGQRGARQRVTSKCIPIF